MTKKGVAANKSHALSLHDFIASTPGALPLAATLPSHHGEVSKVERPDLIPRFGELDLNLGSSNHSSHTHTYHSPYDPYCAPPPSNVAPSSYECGYTENEYGYGPPGAPPAPPPPPRSSHSICPQEPQLHEGSIARSAGQHSLQHEQHEPLVPGAVKLLRKPVQPVEALMPVEAHGMPRQEDVMHHAAEEHRASQLDHADRAEAAAIAAAAEAQKEAAAAAAAAQQPLVEPLVGRPQQQEQQQQRQEAAEVKNEFAERMAARALERMAARSALHSQSSTPPSSAPAPAPTVTTAAVTVSTTVSVSEKPQQQQLQEALKEREMVAQEAVAPQPQAQPQPQPQAQPQQQPQRPKLNLLPRSKPLDVNQPPERVGSSAIFGSGKPREEKVGSFSPSGTGTSLADVKLHSLSAPYGGGLGSRSRGGSVVSFDGGSSRGAGDGGWHTVGSRGKSRAESLAAAEAAAAHEELDCFFTAQPPPPPPRAFGFAHPSPGYGAYEVDGSDILGKRGLPLKRDYVF